MKTITTLALLAAMSLPAMATCPGRCSVSGLAAQHRAQVAAAQQAQAAQIAAVLAQRFHVDDGAKAATDQP